MDLHTGESPPSPFFEPCSFCAMCESRCALWRGKKWVGRIRSGVDLIRVKPNRSKEIIVTLSERVGRVVTATAAGLVVAASVTVPAFAEGTINSHISNGRVGFETRSWWDDDSDGVSTSVSHYSKCNARSVSYELIHEYSWRPDAKLGTQALSCSRTGSRYWGRQVEGDYHVVIRGISGRALVSVNDFRIKY